MNPIGFLFIGMGLFALCGAGFNWDWFMNNRKARFFTSIFGRNGARIFYGLLGTGIVIVGVLFVCGVIKDSR